MRVKLFASLKERAQAGEIEVAWTDGAKTVSDLREAIVRQYPTLANLVPQALVAVNREFAFNADPVQPADEVALFPPVSGGADWPDVIRLTPDPIDLNELRRAVTTEYDGAVVIFTGVVRGLSPGGKMAATRLEYEAYSEMALAKLRQVALEMRARYTGVHGLALVQRVGEMQVGEPTVAVAVAAGHRGDGAFEAARFGIDRLKQIVPVWKREVRPDGSSWIEGDYIPTGGEGVKG